MKKLIVAPNHIINELLEKELSKHPFLFNTSIRSFEFAFKSNELSNLEIYIKVLRDINTLKLPRIGAVVGYPQTIKSIIDFVNDMNAYAINIHDLPTETQLQKEIYSVVEVVMKYIPAFRFPVHTEVSAYSDLFPHAANHYLNVHSIHKLEVPHIIPSKLSYKYARNIRHEIEAVIQEIIKCKLDNAVVAIPNFKSHIPLIEMILKRYGMKVSLEDRSVSLAKIQFIALLNYMHKPSVDSLLTVLQANSLNFFYSDDIEYYIRHFELTLEDCMNSFHYAKDLDKRHLVSLQERIQSEVLSLQGFMRHVEANDYQENVQYAYAILRENNRINTTPIHNFITKNFNYFEEDNHDLILYFIENIPTPSNPQSSIRFIDINELPLFPVDHLYVLNLNASTYPSISSHTGLIDEQYLSRVKGYPSVDLRTNYSLNQQKRFLKLSKNLTLSYNITDYEGKSIEPSYPIRSLVKELEIPLESWNIEQVLYRPKKLHRLHPDIAKALYLQDDVLIGSVSSFEQYMNSPIDYFIEKGLKLQEPEHLIFDARILGTLNHEIVEHIDSEYSENAWEQVFRSFPKHSPIIQMIKLRNIELMELNQNHLNVIDSNMLYSTMEREKRFRNFKIHPNIVLNGIIDRIDYLDSSLMIIDYKSSAKSLSAPQILTGKQLQLLTYGYVANILYNKPIMGVFYYNLASPNIKTSYASYKKSNGVVINEFDPDILYNDKKKLSGWFFMKPSVEFFNQSHFTGLTFKKDGELSIRGQKNFEITSKILFTLFDDIQRNILNGILDVDTITLTLPKKTPFEIKKEKEPMKTKKEKEVNELDNL